MLEHLIPAFSRIGLRMLDVSCARADYDATSGRVIRQIRPRWPHFLIGGASLDPVQAEREVSSGLLDMVVWGRFILANPDFVTRIRQGRALIPFEQGMLAALV
jgi:N-ethylmaleimide reductase